MRSAPILPSLALSHRSGAMAWRNCFVLLPILMTSDYPRWRARVLQRSAGNCGCRMIIAWHRGNETSKRLDALPGVGPALATALVASVADPRAFRSGRDFSAWIGLVPKQNSSGGKQKLGGISKQGDRYLRGLFTAGALAVIRYAKIHGTGH